MDNQPLKHYWFYIDTFVHISIKNGDVLLYNIYSGKIIEFPAVIHGDRVYKMVQRLLSPNNLRVIPLTSQDLTNPVIADFVQTIRESFMGDLIPKEFSDTKPLQVTTQKAKIRGDIQTLLKDPDCSPGQILIEYLSDITLYINDSCSLGCPECAGFFKQGTWCRAQKPGGKYLDISLLQHFFHETKGCNLSHLNICGGNILLYPQWPELSHLLKSMDTQKRFYLHYWHMETDLSPLTWLRETHHEIRLLAHFPMDIERLKKAYITLKDSGLNVTPVFFIQSDAEYANVEELLTQFPMDKPVFLPYYNHQNLDFFQSNVFISREDLEAKKPSQRTIHANGCMNLDNFGRISILANGKVHANVLSPALGTLGKDSIYDCLFKELKTGRSWFKLRKHGLPCKQCTFNLLCPPISNYNRVMHRNNLCHIHQTNKTN